MVKQKQVAISGFVSERLREIRETRGLTQTDLAQMLDLTRAMVSKYEKGKSSPSPEVFQALCKYLNVTPDFFLTSNLREEGSNSPIFFRAMSKTSKQDKQKSSRYYLAAVDTFSTLQEFIEFPKVYLPPVDDIPEDPTEINSQTIETIATKTRRFWGLGDGPISSVIHLLENNGIIVSLHDSESPDLEAFSQWRHERPHIIISNNKKSAARLRFTLAHELGHLILHKESHKYHVKYLKLIEEQANYFAGAFLLTKTAFSQEFLPCNLDNFVLLKHRWNISVGVMISRAYNLGYIDEQQKSNFWRSYSRRGWRRNEPLDTETITENPSLLKDSIEMLVEHSETWREEIQRKSKVPQDIIENISGLPVGFLSSKIVNFPLVKFKSVKDRNSLETQKAEKNSTDNVIDFANFTLNL